MSKRVPALRKVHLRRNGQSINRTVTVRDGQSSTRGKGSVTFLVSGFNEPVSTMMQHESEIGVGTTVVYIVRRLTAEDGLVPGLTKQTLQQQADEVSLMIGAFLEMHPDQFAWAVVHGHSMGSVIAQRILPVLRANHPNVTWYVIAEAPPPWERAPLWFSNKPFWSNGGWAALKDAMKALTTNRSTGREGMVANSNTLYQLYAGGQPSRADFEQDYRGAIPDAPLAFIELAFKSGLGDEKAVRKALHEGQQSIGNSGIPMLQVICFSEDRIFDYSRIIRGMQREARVLTVRGMGTDSGADVLRDTGPTVHVDCIEGLPHVPRWGTDDSAQADYRKAVNRCYRRIML